MSARASGADAAANGSAKHRAHHDGSSTRAYTPEMKAAVIRIRRCKATAFYEILGLEEVRKTCSDGEIKKAYRKLSLLTHPDKNGYEGADEAFKLVSRAFSVLSDPDKKAKFDRFGGDPDNRFGGGSTASQSPFSNFARASGGGGRAGPVFEEEISPEEMFRQFFGGGMGGFGGPFGGFDTGPGFVFNLGGGPGIRVTQFGGQRPRRRPAGAQPDGTPAPPPSLSSAISSLLPLILLFVLPLLSSLLSGPSGPSMPTMHFEKGTKPYTMHRTTERLGIPYWVNPADVDDFGNTRWKATDKHAEQLYIQRLTLQCEDEMRLQQRMLQDAQGWFFVDEEKVRQAREMKKEKCQKLNNLGRL